MRLLCVWTAAFPTATSERERAKESEGEGDELHGGSIVNSTPTGKCELGIWMREYLLVNVWPIR